MRWPLGKLIVIHCCRSNDHARFHEFDDSGKQSGGDGRVPGLVQNVS